MKRESVLSTLSESILSRQHYRMIFIYVGASWPVLRNATKALNLLISSPFRHSAAPCWHAKIVHGLSRRSPHPGVLATLGWLSMSGNIFKIILLFLWRILCLPGNVYKDVVLTILNKCFQCENDVDIGYGPIQDMHKTVCKYNLKDELIRYIHMGDYGDMSERKRLIKRILWEHERCSWRASCLMYPASLDTYCHTFTYVVDVCRQISTFYCKN